MGVETLEELEFLRARQCDEAQGFYFSRPIPPKHFAELLRVGVPEFKAFRSSIPGPPMPLFTLHVPPRDGPRKTRGQDGFAISFPAGLFHPLRHAGLSRRTGGPLSGYDSPPLRLTTGLMSPASAARELTKPKKGCSQLRAN